MLIMNFFLIVDNYNPENKHNYGMLYINNLVVCNNNILGFFTTTCSLFFSVFFIFIILVTHCYQLLQFSLQFPLGTRHKLFMILKACVLLISSLAFGFSCASYPFNVGSLKCILTNLTQKYLYSWQIKQVFHQSDKSAC